MSSQQVFKSAESRDDYIRARYNQILSAFPFPQRYGGCLFAALRLASRTRLRFEIQFNLLLYR